MRASSISKMEVPPIAVAVPQAAQMIGRCVATIYELIGAGEIKAVKSDGRTLIVVQSLHDYIGRLPKLELTPRPRRKPQHMRQSASLITT
jgi:Helix-turn-helix domain